MIEISLMVKAFNVKDYKDWILKIKIVNWRSIIAVPKYRILKEKTPEIISPKNNSKRKKELQFDGER